MPTGRPVRREHGRDDGFGTHGTCVRSHLRGIASDLEVFKRSAGEEGHPVLGEDVVDKQEIPKPPGDDLPAETSRDPAPAHIDVRLAQIHPRIIADRVVKQIHAGQRGRAAMA